MQVRVDLSLHLDNQQGKGCSWQQLLQGPLGAETSFPLPKRAFPPSVDSSPRSLVRSLTIKYKCSLTFVQQLQASYVNNFFVTFLRFLLQSLPYSLLTYTPRLLEIRLNLTGSACIQGHPSRGSFLPNTQNPAFRNGHPPVLSGQSAEGLPLTLLVLHPHRLISTLLIPFL